MKSVIVPLNAFDRVEVLERGQKAFLKLIADSGAYGIEIRRELFAQGDLPLKELREEIAKYSLFSVYSVPIELWKKGGFLNKRELEQMFNEASILGANWVKISLGYYREGVSDVEELKQFLIGKEQLSLLVENDQTPHGGDVKTLKAFFASANSSGIPVMMAFDTGNWKYTGEKTEEALLQLKQYVKYLHFKNIIQNGNELTTCALDASKNAEWRMIADQFPDDLPKALEFPIAPAERAKEYVEMVDKNWEIRKGDAVWNS